MFLVASQKNVVKWEFLLDQRELDRGLRKTQKGFKKTDQESTTLEKGMVKLKQAAVGLGLALGAREVLQFGKDTVQAASDYNESVNAIEVATGDAAAEIQRFGLTADTALGLSKTAVNEMAVTLLRCSRSSPQEHQTWLLFSISTCPKPYRRCSRVSQASLNL